MNGALLRELFENIAAVHGEGLSGACLEISGDGKLLDATVALSLIHILETGVVK